MFEIYGIQIITGISSASLVGVVGYFLKKQNEKIESVDEKLTTMKTDLQKDIKNNKTEIIDLFQNVCHERQDACGAVFEQKLETIRKEGQGVCRKIDSINKDRKDKWKKQDKINDDVKTHLAKATG